jgi:hypothetical protein
MGEGRRSQLADTARALRSRAKKILCKACATTHQASPGRFRGLPALNPDLPWVAIRLFCTNKAQKVLMWVAPRTGLWLMRTKLVRVTTRASVVIENGHWILKTALASALHASGFSGMCRRAVAGHGELHRPQSGFAQRGSHCGH